MFRRFFIGPIQVKKSFHTMVITSSHRRGLTLVEVLVALTASLVLLGAVVSVLGMVSGSISDSRAIIETAGRLRSAQLLLRSDLQGATCNGMVWQKPENNGGYIEIFESTVRDGDTLTGLATSPSLRGDASDFIYFTVRSKDKPFTAKHGSQVIQSNLAEVAWFPAINSFTTGGAGTNSTGYRTEFDPVYASQIFTLYRRVFLIMPRNQTSLTTSIPGAGTGDNTNSSIYDISYRTDDSGAKVPCTLGDLCNRKNRCFRLSRTAFGYGTSTGSQLPASSGRVGEDVVINNVIGFDIKVWDPQALVASNGLLPHDPGYDSTGATQTGCYIDIGCDVGKPANKQCGGLFAGAAHSKSGGTVSNRLIFDTYTNGYETDGIDQDPTNAVASMRNIVDQGTNGLDDDSNGIVDDAGERETSPPYPYPLRGVQITIRVYEPSSGTVRQVTVEESFMR